MSIWASHDHIGYDLEDDAPNRGHVLSYAEGFSNHYPDLSGAHERPAALALASIPAWCVPGHEDDESDEPTGPWLRLDVNAPNTVNHWSTAQPVEEHHVSVVLDEAAAKALMGDLISWLMRPKNHPTRKAA